MSAVELQNVVRDFGAGPVVNRVSLRVEDGELLALLGRSGSGKTTLLRMIAGFERADAGRILIGDKDVTAADALHRRCGMVFQHYALFPHLTVGENVGYGLGDHKLSRDEYATRVAEALAMVDLSGLEQRAVTSLSGGQQQRVALARALAPRPEVLLLDEPLSNLDPTLRERTRSELRELIAAVGITTVLVTHEQEEAFDLAHRVAVLHQGNLEQVAAPESLYSRPATAFMASFIGRASRLTGQVATADDGRAGVVAADIFWPGNISAAVGSPATVMVRPEALRPDPEGRLHGSIVAVRFAGAVTYYQVKLSTGAQVEIADSFGHAPGEPVALTLTGIGVHLYPGVDS